ncbi:SWI/SNF-related matrix-associated actin-dependent regulator of chromatin subfamily B member 1, partial [Lecanoromycetidae sp. Uapishka_2]
MPSPASPQSTTTFSIPQESPLNAVPQNGTSGAIQDDMRNGATSNGNAQPGEPMKEKKQKAKAVLAASGLPATQNGADVAAQEASEPPSRSATMSNGTVQSRKRSRSGTRINLSRPDRKLNPRGPNDPNAEGLERAELNQYIQRGFANEVAVINDYVAKDKLFEVKYGQKNEYMRYRGVDPEKDKAAVEAYKKQMEKRPVAEGQHLQTDRPSYLDPPVKPLVDPAAMYGPGYGQYGRFGNGITHMPHGSIVRLPRSRKRAGGGTTPELRIPRKILAIQSEQLDELVPIRLDIEWEKIRLRDTFTWNLHDRVVPPELFAEQLIEDFKVPYEQTRQLVQQVSTSIHEQIQDFYPHVFIDEEALDPHLPYNAYKDDEMRITIKLNITIGQHTLVDQFEWEINNPANSPEVFARQMTQDLSLAGEFTTAIAHSIREQSQLFTRSLYVTGHPFDGRPVEDQELKAGFLPSPMPSPFRPYQAAKEFTPYLYELNETELEKTELSLSREERRQKRSVNRRGGPALPDLKDRRSTIRTLVVSSVLPGAAETLEESRIFKRTAAASGKGRRPGYGHKDGLDDSDESESDDSAPDSPAIPAHLLAGTARTRGMRGAATVAQNAMRGNLARSATPEATTLHHHETRTSGRRFGGRDYREESVDDPPSTLIVKLRIPRERLRQFLRDQKSRNKPAPLEQSSHRRSLSATPAQGAAAPGTMGPPTTPGPQQQPQQPQAPPRQHGSPGEHKEGVHPLHPHAAQIGRVDAVGPPSEKHPMVRDLPSSP